MRAFKTVNDAYIEPISFIVPRRAEVFQGDIYPPVVGSKPAMSSAEWFQGKEGLPPKIDLESVYAGEEPAEVPADYKPAPQKQPSPERSSPSKKEPDPEAAKEPTPAFRGPPQSMKQQTSSIADLASKFADKDDVESTDDQDDDSSSFEEVSKPVDRSERHFPITKPEEKSGPTSSTREPPNYTASPSTADATTSPVETKASPSQPPSTITKVRPSSLSLLNPAH